MPRPKRLLQQTAEITTTTPPDALSPTQGIARILKNAGNNLFQVALPHAQNKPVGSGETVLVELPSRYRNLVWIRRGGYVVVDSEGENIDNERDNKIWGEIVNIIREEKSWRKMKYWPEAFKQQELEYSYGDATSKVGQMPPSDDEGSDSDDDSE